MRSEVVFRASQRSEERFRLCMLCAKGTRAIHSANDRIQDTINFSFGIIGQDSRYIQQRSPFELQLDTYRVRVRRSASDRHQRIPPNRPTAADRRPSARVPS